MQRSSFVLVLLVLKFFVLALRLYQIFILVRNVAALRTVHRDAKLSQAKHQRPSPFNPCSYIQVICKIELKIERDEYQKKE